ncbi:MAG: asparagine synthase (glutamine-hydrolyzing), partial [Rhodovulum sp.]
VGLAHRRLSILDLSPAGAQPMEASSGRFVLVFNGEIYNHLALREELEKEGGRLGWRGHSDTETLLCAIEHWGLNKTLGKAFGMFALALWDKDERRLSLARDRTGEKPLYLAKLGQGWAFASEPQAFYRVPGFKARIDPQPLQDYLATLAVPDSACVYTDTRKIRPGTILQISGLDGTEQEERYYDMLSVMARGRRTALDRSVTDHGRIVQEVETVLHEVVASQMISDVPLGSFLSGGVDSSLVTALMQEVADRPVKTFTIGFAEAGYDESAHAERVAEHLGTDHTTFRLTEADALDLIPRLPRIYGEPFADSSQIPTALLCAHARQEVTVALTGDGGDEIFGGYNRHVLVPKLWSRIERVPRALRRTAGPLAKGIQGLGGEQSRGLRTLARRLGVPASMLDKAGRFGEVAAQAGCLEDVYVALTRSTDTPHRFLVDSGASDKRVLLCRDPRLASFAAGEWMMAQDTFGYLPSDILVKVDRAAMSVSLETRAPFLDARTIEAAWRLPLQEKIRDGKGKQILREILDRHVPRDLIDRPKQGFAVPMDRWLRGELRGWADELLSRDALVEGGILRVEPVTDLWVAHLESRGNYGQTLWALLMLQAWVREPRSNT